MVGPCPCQRVLSSIIGKCVVVVGGIGLIIIWLSILLCVIVIVSHHLLLRVLPAIWINVYVYHCVSALSQNLVLSTWACLRWWPRLISAEDLGRVKRIELYLILLLRWLICGWRRSCHNLDIRDIWWHYLLRVLLTWLLATLNLTLIPVVLSCLWLSLHNFLILVKVLGVLIFSLALVGGRCRAEEMLWKGASEIHLCFYLRWLVHVNFLDGGICVYHLRWVHGVLCHIIHLFIQWIVFLLSARCSVVLRLCARANFSLLFNFSMGIKIKIKCFPDLIRSWRRTMNKRENIICTCWSAKSRTNSEIVLLIWLTYLRRHSDPKLGWIRSCTLDDLRPLKTVCNIHLIGKITLTFKMFDSYVLSLVDNLIVWKHVYLLLIDLFRIVAGKAYLISRLHFNLEFV